MTDVVKGAAVYLRRTSEPVISIARRFKAMKLGWAAIGAVWQDSPIATRFLNTAPRCREIAKALRDVGIPSYVWGYPWIGGEQTFIARMVDCAGDDALHLLDPELGMNPTRDEHAMAGPNTSAETIVHGLRSRGAKVIGLSTFGGVPSWFPLRAFLRAGVDFVGGQVYTDDGAIDPSVKEFASEIALTRSHAQEVPNFGLYAKGEKPGDYRSKTVDELRAHLATLEKEPVTAAIGWAENFLTPELEAVVGEFSARLAERCATK